MRFFALITALLALALLLPTAHAQTNRKTYLPLISTSEAPLSAGIASASYLGGSGDDSPTATAIASDGTIVVAGNFPNLAFAGIATRELISGSSGVVRLSRDGSRVLSFTRIGNDISDLEIDGSDRMLVCGGFGVALLSPDASQALWSANPGTVKRCATGRNGGIAALIGTQIQLYGSDGSAGATWSIAASRVDDLAFDSTNGLVIATGYRQKASDLKVAFLTAYDLNGTQVWNNYDFGADAIKSRNLAADSEGRRVSIGGDGKLYFAGFVDGGNAIYGRDPKNIDASLDSQTLPKFDNFSNPFEISGAKALGWYGRYNPVDGAIEKGQFVLSRLSNNAGNSIDIQAISADADGRVVLVGQAFCCIKDRNSASIGGVTVSPYGGGEAYLMVIAADFASRPLWTVFTGPSLSGGHSSALHAATIRDGKIAFVGSLGNSDTRNATLLTVKPFQAAPATPNQREGYVGVWQLP